MIPRTYMSVHQVTGLEAHEGISLGNPLLLQIISDFGSMEITLIFRDESAERTRRLIEAINGAMKAPTADTGPCEKSAYEALHYTYQGSAR